MEKNITATNTGAINTEPTVEPNSEPMAVEKKFTQAELDAKIGEKISKLKKQYDEKYSDYDAFKEWKENQKSDIERQAEREREYEAAKSEIAALKAEKKVIAAKAQPQFAEFIASKLLKTDGDLDKNLEDFKKNNPHFFEEISVKKVSTSPQMNTEGRFYCVVAFAQENRPLVF